MIRLLKAELFKLKKSTAFKVLIVISILISLLGVATTKMMTSKDFLRNSLGNTMTEQQKDEYLKNIEKLSQPSNDTVVSGNMGIHIAAEDMYHPKGKEVLSGTFGSGVIEIIIAVLVASLVASEYSKGTIKNTLAYGKKRYVYYINKIIVVSIAAFICILLATGIAGIAGSAIWGWGSAFTLSDFAMLLKQYGAAFAIIVSLSSLMTLIATLTRNNGATMAIGIVVFGIILHLLGNLYGAFDWFDAMFECTPAYAWDSIARVNMRSCDLVRAVLSSLAITAVAGTIGSYALQKQDIK